ncbi:MAG: discoidin domain-containing protein [Planctomycetia bacterium]|nr:discoidin domain-containing protein [Planctomycetia bacterium]
MNHYLRYRTIILSLFLCFAQGAFCGVRGDESGTNMALNKKYSLTPAPGYRHCTDPDDKIQLTDGLSTSSYFWTQRGTVGWQSAPFAVVTIDLEKVEPIAKIEFTTAAHAGGVLFPRALLVQASDDGTVFYDVCDLMEHDRVVNGPLPEKYGIRCLTSQRLATKGRFVRFIVFGRGNFIFCDEIRIFRGDDALLENERRESGSADAPKRIFERRQAELCLRERFLSDVDDLRRAIEGAEIGDALRDELLAQLDALRPTLLGSTREMMEKTDFRTVFPINAEHADLYKIQARLWSGLGCGGLSMEPAGLWDFEDRFAPPSLRSGKGAALTSVPTTFGEPRAVAFNLYNAQGAAADAVVELRLPNGVSCEAFGTKWTDTTEGVETFSALVPLEPADSSEPTDPADPTAPTAPVVGAWRVRVESGLVAQIWLVVKFDAPELAPSLTTLRGEVRCAECVCPIALEVYPIRFPEKTSLLMGGWDYVDRLPAYSVSETNLASFLRVVKRCRVNAPWGSPSLLQKCEIADDLSVKIDTESFDRWVKFWSPSEVREYFIFLSKGGWGSSTRNDFFGKKAGTSDFHNAVANWMRAWRDHWIASGIDPAKVHLLVHDEPNELCDDYTTFRHWRDAIKAGCPEVNIWEDPCYKDFSKASADLFDACDVLCPNRPMWLAAPDDFEAFYRARQATGQRLHLYSCSGPIRLLDPYSYVLLQAWHAAQIGADASFFWALGDGAGGSSWNEYFCGRKTYAPLFIDPKDPVVVPGKHLEAMRESAQDFEYFVLMRAEIERLEKSGDAEKMTRAEKETLFLETLLDETLSADGDALHIEWNVSKDRGKTTDARRRLLERLTQLRGETNAGGR